MNPPAWVLEAALQELFHLRLIEQTPHQGTNQDMPSSCPLDQRVQALPAELQENIRKALTASTIAERKALGWNETHFQKLMLAAKIKEKRLIGWNRVHNQLVWLVDPEFFWRYNEDGEDEEETLAIAYQRSVAEALELLITRWEEAERENDWAI